MNSNAPLTVYKASAGSGKTFTLAVEYITLLIKNPKAYEHILAVTFTNKATEEMKMRIISQLYGISKRLHDSDTYLEAVMDKTGKTEQQVVEGATLALHLLIHNYNYFRVQTIDAFFQSVLRNMARELDLTANLHIDLNDDQVEEQAVDDLIESLDSNAQILQWIHNYISSNIQDDRSWNVIGDIKHFGMHIFKDLYKKHSSELDRLMENDKFFQSYTQQLRTMRDTIKNDLKVSANNLLSLLQANGYDDKSYYKYGEQGTVLKYIIKQSMQKSPDNSPTPNRVLDFLEDPQRMSGNHPNQQAFIAFAETHLIPMLKQYELKRKKGWYNYQSAALTLQHLSQLRLLHAIASTVDRINRENNRFQLSNTQSLLRTLINKSDSPFIFEKIGAQLKHIMIDEFQDTSRIQWENFKVLLEHCMSQAGSHNLIVGDVKQSIYRWRSGDWKLLNSIEQEFHNGQIATMPLRTNFRSEELIIRFNNAFFEKAVEVTLKELKNDQIENLDQLSKAYYRDDLHQEWKTQDHRGYIDIRLLPSSEYSQNVMTLLLEHVDLLISKGVKAHEIAILVRANKDIPNIADFFMRKRPNLRLVSDEAFRLDASIAVNIIVSAMRVIIHPDDFLTRAQLAKAYQQKVLGNKADDVQLFIDSQVDDLLPPEFLNIVKLKTMPIYALADYLYNIFQLKNLPQQSAYVCAFYDILSNFLNENISSIDFFIQEWDENLHKKTIQSDETDGIRIISIHKSKGLEFRHLMIPFCDWQLEKVYTICCEKKEQDPFDKLPIIPIDFSKKKMMDTVYESEYKEEHLQNVVDNMNLLYVAFTRAEKSLWVTGKRTKGDHKKYKAEKDNTSKNRSEVIEKSLPDIASQLEGSTLTGIDKSDEPLVFTWGDLDFSITTKKKAEDEKDQNVFTTAAIPHHVQVQSFPTAISFRQSNKSREFVSGNEEDSSLTYMKLGNILHSLFSTIRTLDDIEPKLRELELEGIVYDDEISADNIRNKISVALQNCQVRSWFDKKWTVFNECTILTPELTGTKESDATQTVEYRPDRVITDGVQTIVIDFKFGRPRNDYQEQVQRYMTLLHGMGHKQIKGFLWYVLRNHVVPVKSSL